MYKRNIYLKKLKPFINKPLIKVITGMRRVGKSYLLKSLIKELQQTTPHQNILYINKELLEFDFIKNYHDLQKFVLKHFFKNSENQYLFVDEIQEIKGWEKAIASLLAKEGIDIYISGSNANLLSAEMATLISGRYIECPIYSLSFAEFLLFRADKKKTLDEEFKLYLRFGGYPALHHFDFDEEVIYQYINSLYNTILLKDVVKKYQIRNVSLLENITRFVFSNIGNIFSAKRISDYLQSQKIALSVETVHNYISYLCKTFAVHEVKRYDLKGKRILELYEKYYLGDIGLRHALLGFREADLSGVLENIIYLELLRRGYRVTIGKFGEKEVDFIAEKEKEKIYIQSAYLLSSQETIHREFSVLKEIKDNYPKYVLSLDTHFGEDIEGIKRLHLLDFLLKEPQ